MLSRITVLSTISVVALTACATNQENPYYKYSSQYKGAPITQVVQAPSTVQAAPVSYSASSQASVQAGTYTRVNHECLKKEKKHELLGAGLGGTIGAIAGKKFIGGTKGTVIGAGLGGAAGYGIGDKTVSCDPETFVMQQSDPVISAAYVAPTHSIVPTHSVAGAQTVPAANNIVYTSPRYGSSTYASPTTHTSPTDTEFNTISETGTPGYQVLQAQTAQAYQAPVSVTSTQSYSVAAQEVSYDYSANTVAASAATTPFQSEARLLNGAGAYSAHMVRDGDTVYSLSRNLCVGVADIQSLNNLNASYGIKIGDQLQLPASNC